MNIQFLAGGSIDAGKQPLDTSEIWGVTLAGIGIVFAGLILLVLVILIFGKIFDTINQRKTNKESAAAAQKAPKAPAPKAVPAAKAAAAAPPASGGDEDEIVAVISAVIAAMSEADGKAYRIRSVKPAAGSPGRSAWAMDGRRQNTMPF